MIKEEKGALDQENYTDRKTKSKEEKGRRFICHYFHSSNSHKFFKQTLKYGNDYNAYKMNF